MHELSLAVSLVDQVEQALEREKASQVLSITVSIGRLSGVEREPFEFCFPEAVRGSRLEGAQLRIEEVEAVIRCRDCGCTTEVEDFALICGRCGSSSVLVIEGNEFLLRSLEVT